MGFRPATLAACVMGLVLATGPRSAAPTSLEVRKILKEKQEGVPADFECGWRQLAYKYAQQLQPFRTTAEFAEIYEALALGACGAPFTLPEALTAPAAAAAAASPPTATGASVFVDPVQGSDSNPGTITQPVQHLPAAVSLTRSAGSAGAVINLRAGVHRLTETLALGPQDSGLTITAYNGEAAVVSSGVVLPVSSWTAYNVSSPVSNNSMSVFNNSNNVFGEAGSDPSIVLMGNFATYEPCQAACTARPNCTSFTFHSPSYGPPYGGTCWERSDSVWAPTAEPNIWSGFFNTAQNVWVTDLGMPGGDSGNPLPPWINTPTRPDFVMSLLYSPDGGASTQRATRARYPNAAPETDLFPKGWTGGGTYASHPANEDTQVVHVPNPNPGDPPGMFATDYWWGYGGPCERLIDNGSYWCQPNGRVAGQTYFVNTPDGLTVDDSVLPTVAQYAANPSAAINGGAIINYWRHGHWFTLMSRLSAVTPNASGSACSFTFGTGLFQGCEGDKTGEDWYIENSPFELDYPNEFYYDGASGKLYYFHNATAGTPPPPSWTFEVPMLQTLISVTGSAEAPATGITLSGLTFTSAAPTYLAPHGLPSGGDWGLSRLGAVLLEGTQSATVESCTFSRVDGNGVFFNGWNRNGSVDKCSFKYMGESAVATWGYTDGVDATSLNISLYTSVTNNLCRLIGSTEKQVSCFGQFVSGRSIVANNIFWNVPRAAVNFNDFTGGGSQMTSNLIWATCTESQDHGVLPNVNSWDRVPYVVPAGFRQPNLMSRNFLVAGGGANGGAFDTDDGSSFYEFFENVEIYGGHKSDFDGHSKRHFSNVQLFASVYGPKCVAISNLPSIGGFHEGYYNNTCVITAGAPYMNIGACDPANATDFASKMRVGGNAVYLDGAAGGTVSCGKTYAFADWMALGLDAGTTLTTTLPTTQTMMGWAAALLGIN